MFFSKEFYDVQLANIQAGKEIIAEKIKVLIYKTIPDYFELLDFENDNIFLDPMLFAQIRSDKPEDADALKQILYGSIEDSERPASLQVKSDKYGNIYLPSIGWIPGVTNNTQFLLEYKDGNYFLDGRPIIPEPLSKNNDLGIELVKYPVETLDSRYYDRSHNMLEVDITEPYNLFHDKYNKALGLIGENANWMNALISKCVFKSVIFNDGSDPVTAFACKRNSFASFMVKGISFHNVYQPSYDEVFFIDDISHQMGHVIFDFLTYDKSRFYKANPETIFASDNEYGRIADESDSRSYEILFHSLYTYFLTLNSLDNCLEKGNFTSKQKDEIKGRIGYYIRKSAFDFEALEPFDKNEVAANVFTEEGLHIYLEMKKSFARACEKYYTFFKTLDFTNQTYNYNHVRFMEVNSLQSA